MPRWTQAQTAHGTADHGAVADHRRSRHAQAAADRRRELLEIIMRRYERASTLLTSNRRWKTGANCWRQRRRLRHARSSAASRTRAQVRPAQLAHQNRQRGRRQMTRAKQKQKRFGCRAKNARGVATRDPEASPASLTLGILVKTRNPLSASHRANRRGLEYRFLRSQPASRPWITPQGATRRSNYNLNTHQSPENQP